MGFDCEADILFLLEVRQLIVYNRKLEKKDITNIADDEELIFYKDNNIAFTINCVNNNYVLRKKKIFNNELIDERFIKTPEQIVKIVE